MSFLRKDKTPMSWLQAYILKRTYLYFSIFNWTYREHYSVFQEMNQEAIPGKAEWTKWKAISIKLMERLLKTSLVSGKPDTPMWFWNRGDILFDFPDKILLNTSLIPRESSWMYRMEMNGTRGSCLQSTLKLQVGGSCLVFINSFTGLI